MLRNQGSVPYRGPNPMKDQSKPMRGQSLNNFNMRPGSKTS